MVITVTLNPAMDKTLSIDDFKAGEVNRVSSMRYDIGGKGINVSKVLKNFGVETICTGFLGGIWQDSFEKELDRRGINHKFVHIDGNTRTNTKIVDAKNNMHTDINEAGPIISEDKLQEFINMFRELCSEGSIAVLSGGINPSVPKNIYATLTTIAKEKGALVILDADGEALYEGIKSKPFVIKPNHNELKTLLGVDTSSVSQIVKAAETLKERGISNIMVSMGEEGALYLTEEGVFKGEGLKVPVKSTVGAGDSMVAAIVYSLLNKSTAKETLAFAEAAGTAAVMLEGTEACTLEQVRCHIKQVEDKIEKIS